MNAEGGNYENALLAALSTENKAIVKLLFVYLSTSAIDKGTQQKPSEHTIVLLGYILVCKLECFTKKTALCGRLSSVS